MKPLIGIVIRPVYSEENYMMYGVYESLVKTIIKAGGIPIGILPTEKDINDILNQIDGLVFQGGDYFTEFEKILVNLAYSKNIKTLGICLGMQLMGTMNTNSLKNVKEHKYKDRKYVHIIKIKKDSILYKIFNKENIMVNSRHNSVIDSTNFDIVALSEDGFIEAIEANNKDFFVGVQWHPESMIDYDPIQFNLFKYFIDRCSEL